MIDRKKGPKISTEFDLSLTGVKESILDNGIELYEVNTGTQNIIKIDLVFRTGRVHEISRAIASSALSLIREGSTRHSSEELAYEYDFYGATVKTACNMEYASISLVVLERYFEKIWPTWQHMLLYPAYSNEEVEKYTRVSSQRLTNQLAKNDVQSYRCLTEHIFGSEHPYGYNTEPDDINSIKRDQVLDFYNKNVGIDGTFILLSGKYTEKTRAMITNSIGSIKRKTQHPTPLFKRTDNGPKVLQVQTQNDIQTSIKFGKALFHRKHKDYNEMKFLVMVLGGYFGSRLMRNIREDKGYTYGIYSSMHGWKEDGFLYISADVDNQFRELTISEVKKEINDLRENLIQKDELEMVRSFILGQTLHLLDGPFAKIELMKNLKINHLTVSDYDKHIGVVKNIDADRIRELANQYLDPDSFSTALAGSFPN